MGGAGDRKLVVGQVVASADERESLQRLRRGAHEARQGRIARRYDHLAPANGDGMDTVHRLDNCVAAHLDDNRLPHAGEPYVPMRMVGISSMVGICRPLMDTTTRPKTH